MEEILLLTNKYQFTNSKTNTSDDVALKIDSSSRKLIDIDYVDEVGTDLSTLKDYCTSLHGYVGDKGTMTKKTPYTLTLSTSLIQVLLYFKSFDTDFNLYDFINNMDLNDKDLERSIIFAYNLLKESYSDNRDWVWKVIVKSINTSTYSDLINYAQNHFSKNYVSEVADTVREKPYSLQLIKF